MFTGGHHRRHLAVSQAHLLAVEHTDASWQSAAIAFGGYDRTVLDWCEFTPREGTRTLAPEPHWPLHKWALGHHGHRFAHLRFPVNKARDP